MRRSRVFLPFVLLALLASAVFSVAFGPEYNIEPRPGGFQYHPSPEDWRDVNMYQIFTDRFYNGDTGNDNIRGWRVHDHDTWYRHRAMGGDWAGVKEKIPYLKGMGINAIWISGVQMNAQGRDDRYTPYHAYHPTDFYKVEPMFGTFEELKDLIDTAHANDMYILIDVVINHMADLLTLGGDRDDYFHPHGGGDLHWWGENRHAPPFDQPWMFNNNGKIMDWHDSHQVLWGAFVGTDDLKTSEQYVRDHLIDIFKYLIDATDCDGFRVDAIKHVERDFMMHWAQEIRNHAAYRGKHNFLLFGEDFDYSDYQVGLQCDENRGGTFNSALYFPMQLTIKNVFAYEQATRQITERRNALHHYGSGAQNLVSFMDNHDVDRIALECGDAWEAKMRPALTFLYTGTPVPCLFYGTEQGFNQGGQRNQGIHDGDYQREVMWDFGYQPGNAWGYRFDTDAPLYQHIAKLNELRALHPSLRRGDFTTRWEENSKGIYAYTRSYYEEEALVVFNTDWGTRHCEPEVGKPDGTVFVNMLNPSESLTVSGGRLNISVGAKESKIFIAGAYRPSVEISCTRDHLTITYDQAGGPLEHISPVYIGTWHDNDQNFQHQNDMTQVDDKWQFVYPLADVDHSVTFYFHDGGDTYDNNNNLNWVIDTTGCGLSADIDSVHGTSHFPENPVPAGEDLWVDVFVEPRDASASANVIFSSDGGSNWNTKAMTLWPEGSGDTFDRWHANLGAFEGGTTVRYAVQVVGRNQEVWDNNDGEDYRALIEGSSAKIHRIDNIRHWPENENLTANKDLWIDLDVRPKFGAQGGLVIYSVNGGPWQHADLELNDRLEEHDAWHVNLGTFPAAATIQYAVMVYDEDGVEYWDNNHGADYFATVKHPETTISWFGKLAAVTTPRPEAQMDLLAGLAEVRADNLPFGTRFTLQSSVNLKDWASIKSHVKTEQDPYATFDPPEGADRIYYRLRVDDVPSSSTRAAENEQVIVRIETQPVGEAASAFLVYELNHSDTWHDRPMTYAGVSGDSDVWRLPLGAFPRDTTIRYAVRLHDNAGREVWDNKGGEDHFLHIVP